MRLMAVGCWVVIVIGPLAAQDVVLSEFMALNLTTLTDEDGDWSDWIELHNRSATPVDLQGWALTDDPSNPFRWVFPAETIPAFGHLLVFASGKDRTTVGAPLHTNFGLSGDGEYLALIRPSGVPATAFFPAYPPQRADYSYGFAASRRRVLDAGAPCWATIPQAGSPGPGWKTPSAPPASWIAGATGAGYETVSLYTPLIGLDLQAPMHGVNGSAYILVPFEVPAVWEWTAATLSMRYDDGFVAWVNGQEVARANAPAVPQWNSVATAEHIDPLAVEFEPFDAGATIPALVPGTNWLAIHGLNLAHDNVDFLITPKLHLGMYDLGTRKWLETPTPGSVNTEGFPEFVSPPTITPPASMSGQAVQATLSCATPGATILYTTDGSLPSASNGTPYSGPIAITDTTTLRAVALRTGFGPSPVSTRTWVFPASVVSQPANPPGLPSTWGTHTTTSGTQFTAVADYGMDGSVASAATIEQSLRSLPSLCFTMAPDDLWSTGQGLYANPQADWERAASVELIYPDNRPGFTVDCGVQNHGHGSRLPWLTPKHGFRLRFRSGYGASRLDHPVFGPNAGSSFETLVVKGGFNDAFTITLPSHDLAIYCRDQYVRSLQRAMGHPSAHGTWVHLYLNGLYWGLYHIVERPDGVFNETYVGGDANDHDVLKHKYAEVVQGDLVAWNTLYGLAGPSTAAWNAVQPWLDTTNFVDYFLLNFYMGTGDWMPNNWYAGRRRQPGAGFKMYVWDAELALKDENRTGLAVADTPAYIYDRLKGNAEFQVLFADRAQRFLFDGGPLTPANAQAALQATADEVQPAIVAESARWGDWLPSHSTFTLQSSWQPALSGHLNFLVNRRDDVVGQLQSAGLYPTVVAPTFSQHGGPISGAFQLTITAPAGVIHFTTDGTDPRVTGGALAPTAQTYTGPIALPNPVTTLKARVLSAGSWSALVEATFRRETVVLNEFLASNQNGIRDEAGDRDDWIELHNPTATAVSLAGFWLTDDLSNPTRWQIPDTFIAPGRTLLIWADDEPDEGHLHATFKLSASGEEVGLFMPDGVSLVDSFTFGAQVPDVSTGRFDDGSPLWVTFPSPTGGRTNTTSRCTRQWFGTDPTAYPMVLAVNGIANPGATLTLTTSAGPPSTLHSVVGSFRASDVPLPTSTGNLLIGPMMLPLVTAPSSASGDMAVTFTIPNDPSLVGARVFLQAWAVSGPAQTVVSNGLEIRICH